MATTRSGKRAGARSGGTGGSEGRPLTARQQAIVDFIARTQRARGYPPTVREIGDAVGLASPSSVHAQLATLAERGLLKKDPDRPRAIVLTGARAEAAPQAAQRQDVTEIPLVGHIAAGTPILAEEHVEDTITVSADLVGSGTLFALSVRGDSMIEAGIFHGDTVIVRQQQTADDGDIVAALVDDDEATVKTLRRSRGKVVLEPANPAYQPIEAERVAILGRVVSVLRRL